MNPKRGKKMSRDWDKIEKAKQWKDKAEQEKKKEMKKGKQKKTQVRVDIEKGKCHLEGWSQELMLTARII